MRIHPDFDALIRYSREESQSRNRLAKRVQAHLQDCTLCRERVEWSRSVVKDYRVATEVAAPPEAWEVVARRVGEAEAVVLPSGPVPVASPDAGDRRTGKWSPLAARAAVLLLLLAGAVSAMVPGSPLRDWLTAVLDEGPQPKATVERASAESAPATASFVLPTHGGVLRVVFHRPDPALVLRVRTGDAGELTVQATGPAAGARFARAPSRIDISDPGSGEILLVLPRADGEVRIELEGRPVLWQEAGRLIVPAPISDSAGSELVIRVGEISPEGGAP